MRQLFLFWQFNGDNHSFCNQRCPYCYGREGKNYRHFWNGDINGWEKAFERLNRDIYFVMSYGETFGGNGFYDCVDMIGKHPNWTLAIVTNLSYDVTRLIESRLGREKRVFIMACWHPLGVADRKRAWENFKRNLLKLQKADIPVHVLYLWYKPQIRLFRPYFEWLDKHGFRVNIRRYVGNIGGYHIPFTHKIVGGQKYPRDHSETEMIALRVSTCEKMEYYTIDLKSPRGLPCLAGKDLILVKYNGDVGLCADCPDYRLGNIFDPDFKLADVPVKCPTDLCGGYYGMLHLLDERFGALPERLENDTFVSIAEHNRKGSGVTVRNREVFRGCLKQL